MSSFTFWKGEITLVRDWPSQQSELQVVTVCIPLNSSSSPKTVYVDVFILGSESDCERIPEYVGTVIYIAGIIEFLNVNLTVIKVWK